MNSDATVAYSIEEYEEEGDVGTPDSGLYLRKLHFWYIDSDGKEVRSKDQAAVTINGESYAEFFVDILLKLTLCICRCGVCGFSDKMW